MKKRVADFFSFPLHLGVSITIALWGDGGGSTIRRVHLFIFSGLENRVDTLSLDLIFIDGKFVFSFYCHSVIN